MLHQNAVNGSDCALETTYEQPGTIQGLPKSQKKKKRVARSRLAGHCSCYNEEIASKVLFWEPQHGHLNHGRPRTAYINTQAAQARCINYRVYTTNDL